MHSIIVGGSTGEYYAQTNQERFDLAAYAKKVIGNRLPLIVGTGATRAGDSVEYAKAAKEIGADTDLVSTPPTRCRRKGKRGSRADRRSRREHADHALQLPCPRMGVMMGEEYFSRVGKSKNVVAIKESSARWPASICWLAGFPHIALSCGWDDQALEFFAPGRAQLGLRWFQLPAEGARRAL